ncbi:MAG: alkaline phosphatase family protein, partial [Janthinobacterium lividum]
MRKKPGVFSSPSSTSSAEPVTAVTAPDPERHTAHPPPGAETRAGRRRFLGGLAAVTAGGALGTAAQHAPAAEKMREARPARQTTDRRLRERVKNIVVIYAENRSFNNLFADFPGLASPLSAFDPARFPQRDRDGKTVLPYLPPVPGGWVLVDQTADGLDYRAGEQYQIRQPNAPFELKGPRGEALPLSIVTHDLWHVFYQNQMQINGGRNDLFVAWANSGGFTMGRYGNAGYSLQLWNIAAEFVLCDNFFQGAFG